MKFIELYHTEDRIKILQVKNLLDRENIDYRILNDTLDKSLDKSAIVKKEKTIEVADKDLEKAKQLMNENGITREKVIGNNSISKARTPLGKWLFIILASFVLVIVALLIIWFMSAE